MKFNPLPHVPILGSSNSAAKKDMMSKILKKFLVEGKLCGEKKEIARYEQFLLFPLCFQKLSAVDALK